MKLVTRSIFVVLIGLGLLSCGGGDSESTPPALAIIDNTNAQPIVKGFFRVMMGTVMGSVPLADLAGIRNYTCITRFQEVSPGTFTTETNPITLNSTITLDQCHLSYHTTFTGQLEVSPTVLPLGYDVHFVDLYISNYVFYNSEDISVVINGNLSVSVSQSGTTQTFEANSSSISVVTDGETYTVKDLSITAVKNTADNYTYRVSGIMSGSTFTDSVQVSTEVEFTKLPTARYYASSGQLKFSGKDSTYITVSANGDENSTPQVKQVSLDVNGVTVNYSWDDIRAWAGVGSQFNN